jgi:hypothetical protein
VLSCIRKRFYYKSKKEAALPPRPKGRGFRAVKMMKMATKYNIFILEVVKAWIRPTRKKPKMIHHCGQGVFVIDGKTIKLTSKKK